MGITTYACHPTHAEIKRCQFVTTIFAIRETSLFEEGNDKGTKTTVDVETNVVFRGECTESDDVVLVTVREIDRGAYELGEDRDVRGCISYKAR